MKSTLRFMACIVLPFITIGYAYSQYGNNDKNGTDGKFENFYYHAGVTPIDPYTGNVHTEIKDLEVWGSAGDIPLLWMRYGNSRQGSYPNVYGTAHHWNSSYMYYMADAGINARGQAQLLIHYPEGGENIFIQDTVDTNLWLAPAGVGKRLFMNGNNFTLQASNGFRYRFEKLNGASGDYYQLQDIKDSHQNLFLLNYEDRRLTKVVEPAGRFLEISYASVGGMSVIDKVTTSDGRSVQYNYNAANGWIYLTGADYGDGTTALYEYSQSIPGSRPVLIHANDPRSNGKAVNMKYTYNIDAGTEGFIREQRNGLNDSLMVTLTTDTTTRKVCYRNGRVQVYEMPINKSGLVTLYTDGLGRQTAYKYGEGGNGFLSAETDPSGRITVYNLRTSYGNLLKITYPDGSQESWTRDDLNLILSHTDESGRVTNYTRDANHNITGIDFPDGTHETFAYNGFGQVTQHIRKNGGVELSEYDSRGLLIKFTDALSNITTYTYNTSDLLAAVTDARGNTTKYEYDERGLMTQLINADQSFKGYNYDTYGNRTVSVNELGDTTTFLYDEFRRKLNQKAPLGRGTEYSYDFPGVVAGSGHDENKPAIIKKASGKVTAFEYDAEWEKTGEIKGTGAAQQAITSYEYDLAGNIETMIDPNGNAWTYEYDARDRRITAEDPLGNTTKWKYDAVGNVLQTIWPDNATTVSKYDNMNRVISITDPKLQITKFKYDAEGNIVLLADPKNNSTAFEYDLLKRQTKMIYPNGTSEIYTYDAVSNLATYSNRSGAVRNYSYDNRNRDTSSTWSDNTPAISKAYDVAGRLRKIANNISIITYVYNAAGQLTGEQQKTKGLPAKTIKYNNNSDGLRDSLTYPDGTVVTYNYSSRNLLNAISVDGAEPLVKYTYDLNDNRVRKDLENATRTIYEYDAANRLLILDNKNTDGSFASFDYDYDNVDRRTYVKRNNDKGDVYAYDAIDQVTDVQYEATNPDSNATNPVRTVHYKWDAAGNRDTVTDNSVSESYAANNLNQYTKAGDTVLTYDANGNLRKHNGWIYTYDAQNRMVNATNRSATAKFDYDALNRCIKRTINGTITFFYYDDWNLIEERNAADVQVAKYIHGARIDEILKKVTPAKTTYYQHDGLGNVVTLTDNSGAVIEKYSYDVFGTPVIKDASGNIIASSAFSNRFMFTGREYIQELGLYDYRNRMYSPSLGRFLQTDPLMFNAEDVNVYRYVGNNSINQTDIYGLSWLGNAWRSITHRGVSGWNASQGRGAEEISPSEAKEAAQANSDANKENEDPLPSINKDAANKRATDINKKIDKKNGCPVDE